MPGPVPVQRGVSAIPNGTASWVPTITLPNAPASGNLLVAVVYGNSSAMSAAAGWTQDTATASGSYNVASFYKYAGVGESATQTPVSTSESLAGLVMWEVTNVQGAWSRDHVASGGGASSTANSTDSFSFTTSVQDTLVLGAWVGNCPAGTSAPPGATLSALTVTAQQPYGTQGGASSLYMLALAGELGVTASGTAVTDNWNLGSDSGYQQKIYIQLSSDFIPSDTQGVSQITAYTEAGVPGAAQAASAIAGYSLTGAPAGQAASIITGYSLTGAPVALQVSSIVGYTMVGPRPNSAYVSVMS